MLQNYQAGGSFDDAAMGICKQGISTVHLVINYPTIPARVVWTKPVFTALTDWSGYATDCHEEEAADESADENCSIVTTPAPGEDGTGGPRWTLSAAAKAFAA